MTFDEWFNHKVETKIFDDTPATRYIAEAAYGAGMKDTCLKDPEVKYIQNMLIEANNRNMDNLGTIKELNNETAKLKIKLNTATDIIKRLISNIHTVEDLFGFTSQTAIKAERFLEELGK